jgi:hypothetical protein
MTLEAPLSLTCCVYNRIDLSFIDIMNSSKVAEHTEILN